VKGVLALILAGGQGDRLSVLSEERAKPAVPFGSRYRIIDFALSNCVNSGITKVGILTQYRPRSLNEHIGIGQPWGLDRESPDGTPGITLLQPYLGRETSDWYRGTADAVYQNLYFVEEARAEKLLILAGDHVYIMRYNDLLAFHDQAGADVTVPLYEVPIEEAHRYGVLEIDPDGRVISFEEKPEKPRSNLISMGIYVFDRETLFRELIRDARADGTHDFGRDVIPHMVASGQKVYGYRFSGYWRDVGTIESYYQANMDLLEDLPELNLYDPDQRVLTRMRGYPPPKVGRRAYISRSLLDQGCIINGHVEHSVLSPGVFVEEGAVVRDSIVFDDVRVATGAIIERSIIDKQVYVGKNAYVGYGDDYTPNRERPDIVYAGITVVGKRAKLPAYIRVGRNVVIGPGVTAHGLDDNYIPSGSTLRMPARQFLYGRTEEQGGR
jgi:glucose-1-phosphate adenylyltransferase